MENYSTLVSKVLPNKTLVKTINNILDENSLNLVVDDWQERLENNVIYQDYVSHLDKIWTPAYKSENYEYENSKFSNFTVVIVSYCKFYKSDIKGVKNQNPNLIILNSEPLNKIARVMTSDLGSRIQLSNDFKFNFIDCATLYCNSCRDSKQKLTIRGRIIPENCQPCIADTQVYNGEEVFNCFFSEIQKNFPSMFLAILKLKIKVRYNVKDANKQKIYRISGDILDFIGFNERKLTLNKKIKLEPLMEIDNLKKNIFGEHSTNNDKALDCLKEAEMENLTSFLKKNEEHDVENDKENDKENEILKDNLTENDKSFDSFLKKSKEDNAENDEYEDLTFDTDMTADLNDITKKRKYEEVESDCETESLFL